MNGNIHYVARVRAQAQDYKAHVLLIRPSHRQLATLVNDCPSSKSRVVSRS